MDLVKTTFIDKGIPVIMGEYGTTKKERSEETVRLYLTSVCKEAYSRGICPVLWDTTGNFYDRQNAKMYDETLHQQLLAIVSPAEEQKKAA
jgi:endoglucanase